MNTALLVTLITALTKYIYALESLQQVPSCAVHSPLPFTPYLKLRLYLVELFSHSCITVILCY